MDYKYDDTPLESIAWGFRVGQASQQLHQIAKNLAKIIDSDEFSTYSDEHRDVIARAHVRCEFMAEHIKP